MSKISEEAARAFEMRRPLKQGNTEVKVAIDGAVSLWLHRNLVAYYHTSTGKRVSLAGWPTVTTRSRLNALPGVHVHQHKGEQYLNGEPWDGSWTTI